MGVSIKNIILFSKPIALKPKFVNVAKIPATPVPTLMSPTQSPGNSLRNPIITDSPKLYYNPVKILANIAIQK